jgi:hypothetical protein
VRQQTDEEELRAYFPNLTEADWAKIKGGHTWDNFAGNNIYHNLVKRRLEPLKKYLGLSHAELEKIVLRQPAVLTLDHNNLVHEKLKPLQALLDLNAAELKKIVLSTPQMLGLDHNSEFTKLRHQQECLGLTDEELRAKVIAQPMALGYGKIKEKWALMMSGFAEEAGDQKLQALRKLGFRGLGVGEPRLKRRLADLREALGSAPKASEWLQRLAMDTDAQWAERLSQLPNRLNTSE